MFKRDVTYKDLDGETVTDTIYFNLTKTEILKLEVEYKDGFKGFMDRIIKTEDRKQLYEEFQKIVLLAYGQKSDDGKRFIKNDTLREEFSQTLAFDALFMELATNAESGALFINGIMPADLDDFVKDLERRAAAEELKNSGSPPAAIMPKAPAS